MRMVVWLDFKAEALQPDAEVKMTSSKIRNN